MNESRESHRMHRPSPLNVPSTQRPTPVSWQVRPRALVAIATVLMLLLTPVVALINVGAASSYAAPAFQTQWNAGEAVAPNFWGPLELARNGQQEPYVEAPGGMRTVQYFDKARMEVGANNTVTNGLLATELITGNRQLGDTAFQNFGPANIPVAGDPDNAGPTYAAIQANAAQLRNPLAATMGAAVTLALTPNGQITTFATGASFPQANIGGYDSVTQHNVPTAFLTYWATAGIPAIGLAITEPFWSNVKVAGRQQDVLMQAFERRVLTFTPSNPAAFQVEFGNIGQHYYAWRYMTGSGSSGGSGGGGGGVSPTAVNSTATTTTTGATATPVATTSATATSAATATATVTMTPTTAPVPVTLTGLSITNVTMSKATVSYTTSVLTCGTAELRVKGDTSWSTNIDSITCAPLTMSVTSTLTSLNPNTIYEVRGAAKNASGTIGYSTVGSFTTLTAQPTAESYDGNWVNDNATSGGAARFFTTTANNMITVHGYGQCGGGECDWGTKTGTFTGDPFAFVFPAIGSLSAINVSMSFTDDTRTHLKVVWSDGAAGTHTETFHRRYIFSSPIYTGGIKPVLIKP